MRTPVTGCVGFIGSTLTNWLVSRSYDTPDIERLSAYNFRDLKEAPFSLALRYPQFSPLGEDILELEAFLEFYLYGAVKSKIGIASSKVSA